MRALVVVALAGCWMNSEPQTIVHDTPVVTHTVRAGHRAEEAAHGTGLVEGVITDIWTGMPLPGVTVELVAHTPQKKRSTVTDLNGYYAFARLAADDYECDLIWDRNGTTIGGAPIGVQRRLIVQQRAMVVVGDGAQVRLDVTIDSQNANVFFGP